MARGKPKKMTPNDCPMTNIFILKLISTCKMGMFSDIRRLISGVEIFKNGLRCFKITLCADFFISSHARVTREGFTSTSALTL